MILARNVRKCEVNIRVGKLENFIFESLVSDMQQKVPYHWQIKPCWAAMAGPSRELLLLVALLPFFAASVAAMKDGFRIKVMNRCGDGIHFRSSPSSISPCVASNSGLPKSLWNFEYSNIENSFFSSHSWATKRNATVSKSIKELLLSDRTRWFRNSTNTTSWS